jgi:hypothetical protein
VSRQRGRSSSTMNGRGSLKYLFERGASAFAGASLAGAGWDLGHSAEKVVSLPSWRPNRCQDVRRAATNGTKRSSWQSACFRRHLSARKLTLAWNRILRRAHCSYPHHCARRGQIEAQKWIAENPTWRLRGGPVAGSFASRFSLASLLARHGPARKRNTGSCAELSLGTEQYRSSTA